MLPTTTLDCFDIDMAPKTIPINYESETYQFPIFNDEIYNLDPANLIRFKCSVLVAITPVVSLARSIYWLCQSYFLLFSEAYNYLDKGSFTISEIQNCAIDSARAIKYGAQMSWLALNGIFNPYQYRCAYGECERILNHQQIGKKRDKFYLAICFQPIALVSEQENLRNARLTKHAKINYKLSHGSYSERIQAVFIFIIKASQRDYVYGACCRFLFPTV